VNPLDVLFYGTRAATAGALAGEDRSNVAADVAQETLAAFEQAAVHDPLEGASGEAYEAFEGNLEAIVNASGPDAAAEAARASLDGAIEGAYAFGPEPLAGAGHISAYQARGWDAAAATHLGGPGTDYGHAAALNIYRARAYDAHWVATRGETDTAATMAGDIFAHFEGARAHEALEEASGEAYEGFEGGLSDLRSAIENGNSEGIGSAVERVDSNLVTGIEALAGGNAPLLQAGFFKARFADARELYRQDKNGQAAAITHGLFQRFEANELDFHETLEETSDQLYQTFEEEHLSALVTAYENDDESSVETHHQGVQDALLQFEAEYSAALASGAEATYMAALGFDAAGVDTLGNSSRAAAIAQSAFQHFEQGAAGYHEALEEADSELYESFEAALGAIRSAAENGSAVYPESKTFNEEAVASAYAIAEAGGSGSGAAAVVGDVFASFEQARVHEMLEEADTAAYEGFEAALTDYQSALESGDASTAGTFADAARTAQFAVAGSVDAAPSGSGGGSGEETEESEPSLEGGPNVVEDVPDDADHVVEMQAVAFNPAELTVSAGDTVAFEHVGGEAHNVVAYQDEIPENAEYWASGGFDSEEAARQGWENGQGAVQSGQSYVHTFETTGEHNYFCVPHEAAGMVGTIVVE
jgi:plastocyanin